MAIGKDGIKLASSTAYDFAAIKGRLYAFEVFYGAAATGTVTASQKFLGEDGTAIYQNITLPTDPTAVMAITATGVARGFDLRATSNTIRLTSGVVANDVYVSWTEVAHGRA